MTTKTFDQSLLRDLVTRLEVLLPPDVHGLDLGLGADLPIALLPVRLEARFSTPTPQAGRVLRVRVIPDDLHVPALDDGITDVEATLANRYRDALAAAAPDPAGAWHDLVAGVGSTTSRVLRAAWLAGQVADSPVSARPSSPLTARALPDRWFVSAYGGDTLIASVTSADVRTDLRVDPRSSADEALWLTDFAAAVEAGMGVELTVDAAKVDVLLALGVRGGDDGARDAAELAALLDAHRYSRGVDLLRPGTPTNNTPTVRSAWRSAPDAQEILRQETDPPVGAAELTNGRVLTGALGIPADAAALSRPFAAAATDQVSAHAMLDLLWPVTGGELLSVLLSDRMVTGHGIAQAVQDEVRDHASRYLRGRGPLPSVLVGRQPYGVLPVSSLSRWATGTDGSVLDGLRRRLLTGWAFWEADVRRVRRLGGSGDDGVATELVARLMCQSPVPNGSGYRATTVLPPNFSRTLPFLPVDGPLDHDLATGLLQLPYLPLLSDTREDGDKVGTVVLPAVAPGGGARLDSLRTGDELFWLRLPLMEQAKEDLLSQLAQRALLRSAERAATWVTNQIAVKIGKPDLYLPVAATMANDLGAMSIAGALEMTVGAVFGDAAVHGDRLTLGDVVAQPSLAAELFPALEFTLPPSSPEHDAAVGAVPHLTPLPDDELELLMGETLDLFTNRYDAWVTSLATRRLDDLRRARPEGLHLGGFGYLVDLQDAEVALSGADVVHAPSPAQAATAAVLRYADIDDRAASADRSGTSRRFDVTSASVRVARGILDAVGQGQPLSAVLGYRIERFLQDRPLSQHIDRLRRDYGTIGGEAPDPQHPAETVPAHDVVDGVAVWRAVTEPAAASPEAERDRATAAIPGLADHLAFVADALSDLLVAEGVHHLVTGDRTRAGATLTALSRGVPPPRELHVVDAPGRHLAVPVQLLMAVDDRPAPAGGGWSSDRPRAVVAPAAERLARAALPAPADCAFLVEWTDPALPAAPQLVTVGLADLGLCALDVLAEAGADDDRSALASRVRLHLGHEGTLLPGAAPGSAVGWGALTASARAWARVFGTARPLLPTDVEIGAAEGAAPPEPPSGDAVAAAEQALTDAVAAISAATAELQQALTALGTAAPDAGFVASVTAPLAVFGAAGLAGTAQEPGDDPVAVAGLVRRCVTAGVAAGLRLAQLSVTPEVDHPLVALRPGSGDVSERTERLAAATRDIFGEVVVLAPAIHAPAVAVATADASPGLPDGDELADWLGELSEVRTPTRRWWQAQLATESLTGKAPALVPSQFPAAADEGWIGGWTGTPRDWTPPLSVRRAFVTHAPEEVHGPHLAALVVESWLEQVPVGFEHEPHRTDPEQPAEGDPPGTHLEPTGVAVHYNAAGARPPQSILLAVPPDRATATWHLGDLVAILIETIELSRFRGIEAPDDLPSRTVLPAVFVPEGIEGLSFVGTLFQTLATNDTLVSANLHARRYGND